MRNTTKLLLILILFLNACNSKNNPGNITVIKHFDSDPFKNTLIESQFFTINSSEDNVIESKTGNLIVIPKGAFINGKGEIVEDSLEIEFAETAELDEMILSNLIILDSTDIIETQLAFFLNAKQNNQQLSINPENPIYFELSSDKRSELYKGSRDKNGKMDWAMETSTLNYLVTVPIEILDFYPPGFENEVEKGLPFKNHKIISKKLLDSLFYSFSLKRNYSTYYRPNGKLAMINFMAPVLKLMAQDEAWESDSAAYDYYETDTMICGINPASIKAIRSKRFQNTFIATREFEYRLNAIYKTCKEEILELYVNNLDKNLWEIDNMAADFLGPQHNQYARFKEFASYNQTTVKLSDKRAELLARFYLDKKQRIEKEIIKQKQDLLDKRKKHLEVVKQEKDNYRNLLQERHDFRMKKFGIEFKEFGWYNAANKIYLKDVEEFELYVSVENGDQYHRVYAYVINPKIKSIFSLLSENKITFDRAFSDDADLLLWKNQEFSVITVGYKGENIGYNIKRVIQQPETNVKLFLESIEAQNLKRNLKKQTPFHNKENSILVDLNYQAFFFQEEKRKELEQKEARFMNYLWRRIFPCCFGEGN
jgi:hypothetical protein